MKLYKVTLSFDVLVAATDPRQALQKATNEAQAEAATLTRTRIRVGPCEAFSPGWQTLPDGWLLTDHPIGSTEPITSWIPGTVDVG